MALFSGVITFGSGPTQITSAVFDPFGQPYPSEAEAYRVVVEPLPSNSHVVGVGQSNVAVAGPHISLLAVPSAGQPLDRYIEQPPGFRVIDPTDRYVTGTPGESAAVSVWTV